MCASPLPEVVLLTQPRINWVAFVALPVLAARSTGTRTVDHQARLSAGRCLNQRPSALSQPGRLNHRMRLGEELVLEPDCFFLL